jgi:nucleoside-diphosphate-sugar epimerase
MHDEGRHRLDGFAKMDKLILGCGYLGRRVAERWLSEGNRVWATTRSPARAAELAAAGLLPIVCDVLAPASLDALPRVETVLYGVGFDRGSGRSLRDVYVEGLRNALEKLYESPPRCDRLVHVSSTSVHGQTDGSWVDETSPTEPCSESGRIVLEAEGVLRVVSGDRAIILRFAGIYGPGRLLRYDALKSGTPLVGDPDRWLNLIHVADGASAVLAAAERGVPGGVYNVCDDEPVRRGEFAAAIAQLLGTPPPRFVPVPPGNVAGDRGHRRVSNRKMKAELQVTLDYPTYREGLRDSLGVE